MASQSGDFLKKNATAGFDMVSKGVVGKIFGAAIIADIVTSENKLKAVGKALRDIVLMQPLFDAFAIGAFGGMRKAIVSLLHDTGSLEQALKKLGQIQGLQNMFTPLVGGASAAKMKVAELTAFSARFNKSLQETGEAARSLTIMTRGAFASADAMKVIGDAATATGTDMATMADTVGDVYAALRGGESISGAVDRLRALGAISQQTGDGLITLQQNGGGLADVFSATVAALGPLSGSMDGYKDTLAGVNAAHDKAIQSLQEKFASPFVADDIQNTKNWTGAMQAVAPSVERVAGVMSFLIGGLSTASSWLAESLAKWTAFRVAVEVAADAIMVFVTALALWGSYSLAMWCIEAAGAAATLGAEIVEMATAASASLIAMAGSNVILAGAASMAATAMTWLATVSAPIIALITPFIAIAGAIAAVGVGLLILSGLVVSGVKAWNAQADALKKLKDAHNELNAAMAKQINGIKTLQDKHDALTKALENQAKAYDELAAAEKKFKEHPTSANQKVVEEDKKNLEKAKKAVENASAVDPNSLERTEKQKAIDEAAMNREDKMHDQQYQQSMDLAGPEGKVDLVKSRLEEFKGREAAGKAGEEEKYKNETANSEAAGKIAVAKGEEEMAQKGIVAKKKRGEKVTPEEQKEYDDKKAARKKLEEDKSNIGADAPEGSSVKAEYDLRKLQEDRQAPIDKAIQAKAAEDSAGKKITEAKKAKQKIDPALQKDYDEKKAARKIAEKERDEDQSKNGAARQTAIDEAERKKSFALKREDEYSSGATGSERSKLQAAVDPMTVELTHSQKLSELEEKRGKLKSQGYKREQDERDIQLEVIQEGLNYEDIKHGTGPKDKAEIDKLNGQKAEIENQKKIASTAQAYEEGLADTEKQRGEIRETGFERTKKENALTTKDLNNKLAREEAIAKVSGNDTKVKETQGSIAAQKLKEQDALRENVRGNVKSEHEAELQKAKISGDVKRATTIGDVGVYEAKRSELEGQGKTREEADAQAKEFGMNAITLEARKEGGQMNSAVAATDLARIGGGGNIASGDDAIDIAKRQLDYLAEIAANVKREPDTGEGGTPLH